MHKNFTKLGFKAGDTVLCVGTKSCLYKKGKTYKIVEGGHDNREVVTEDGHNGFSATWKKVEKMEYEDQWHLNDGVTEIPENADKLMKDGSVVAYRLVKKPELKFGDIVRHESVYGKFVFIKKYDDMFSKVVDENGYSDSFMTSKLTKVED